MTSPSQAGYVDTIFAYTGRPLDDATGLQNNLHRWYDAETGRWISEDPIGFAGGDANLSRYVGNAPLESVDPNGLESKMPGSQGQRDEEAFSNAFLNNGGSQEDLDLILGLAREIEIGGGRSLGLPIGAHQKCADWVFSFENALNEALRGKSPPGMESVGIPGIRNRRYIILLVPYGAQGNNESDIPWRNWILPSTLDALTLQRHRLVPFPSTVWRSRMLGQIHTVYQCTLNDGSTWLIDLGALQRIRATAAGIDDLEGGRWHITPGGELPNGWSPTDRTAQPSWEPRLD